MENNVDKQADYQGFIKVLNKELSVSFPEMLEVSKIASQHGFPNGTLKAMLSHGLITKDESLMSKKRPSPSYLLGEEFAKLNTVEQVKKLMEILPDGKPSARDSSPTEPHENPLMPLIEASAGSTNQFFDEEDIAAIQKQVDEGETHLKGEPISIFRIQLGEELLPGTYQLESEAWFKAEELLQDQPKQIITVFEQKAVLRAVFKIERVY